MSEENAREAALVEVRGLTKVIRGATVLEGVTLDAPAGLVTGLAGPNGSGKTMLMRCVAGLVRPTSGTVRVAGADPWEAGAGWGARAAGPGVGMLLEGPAFLDGYTGLENLMMLAGVDGRADESAARAAIEAMGLDPDDRRRFRKYSLGMKQRLGVAGAVMGAPGLVLLDEPTNALDPDGVALAVRQVRLARERGAAVIMACHDAGVLRGLSDVVWHMAEGRVQSREEVS